MPPTATAKTEPKKRRTPDSLTFSAPVQLLKAEPAGEPSAPAVLTGFEILAYTGVEIERFWGRMVVALDGIKSAQRMPIFRDHDPSRIVGYSTSATSEGAFSVSGVFSDATEAGEEVRALAAEGFPWQASIGVRALRVLELRAGEQREVNGRTVTGPIDVWLESSVAEVSFVALGADSNTKVTVFSGQDEPAPSITEESQEEGREPMTLEELKQQHPDLVQRIEEDAVKEALAAMDAEALAKTRPDLVETLHGEGAVNERARIADVRNQSIPGHEALIAQLELDGKSTGADAAKAIVAAERELRGKAAANLSAQANPPAPTAGEPETGKKTMKRETFNALSTLRQGETVRAGIRIVD